MRAVPRDVRQAVRGFARQPGIAGLLLLTLTLGIAAAIGVFSLINGVILRPLPFPAPERLVYLNETAAKWNLEYTSINYPDFHLWRQSARAFEGMALYGGQDVNLADRTGSDRVAASLVTHDFARVLGVAPILGRTFTAEEDRPNGPKVVMLGFGLWRSRFGSARDVVGRSLRINSEPYTIVGVLPREAEFPANSQLWLPLAGEPNLPYQSYSYEGIGRLRSGVTLAEARADLERAHSQIWRARDTARVVSPVVEPLRDHLTRDFKIMAAALAIGVVLVLLCACANVASTMLARAIFRQREISLRVALGADPARVGRQLLVESLVLAAVAGVAGAIVGSWGLSALLGLLPRDLPHWMNFGIDYRTILVAVLIVGGTGVVFGLAPMLHARRQDARAVLGSGSRSSLAAPQRRLLHGFVVAEVALATILLVGGGLLFRAYRHVLEIDPGFRVDDVSSFRVALPTANYPDSTARRTFYRRLLERVEATPGVDRAGLVSCPPLGCHLGNFFVVDGAPPPAANAINPVVLTLFISPGYPSAIGMRLTRGRLFQPGDGEPQGLRAVLVSEAFVRAKMAGLGDPIGRTIRSDGGTTPFTVVGVLADVKHYGLDRPALPTVYLPVSFGYDDVNSLAVVVQSKGLPLALIDRLRAVVRELDPELPLFEVGTMRAAFERSLAVRRAFAAVLAFFAALALVLAVGGIYAVLSYVVGRRAPELGIRMALGARQGQVLRLVLRQGIGLVLLGVAIGVPGALAIGRLLSSQLVGLSARDPLTLVAVVGVLLATGLGAALLPARRASAVDPKVALTAE
jgi:predicted permease